jgi:serine/threonine protein kinase
MELIPNYKNLGLLGTGSYGKVYKAEDSQGRLFAIKSIKLVNDKVLGFIEREIEVMKEIEDKNVIKLYEVQKINDTIYLITEFCGGGDLEGYTETSGPVPEKIVKKWFISLVRTFAFLHSKNIMHRDIKLSNLYLTDTDINLADVKVGDFGFARFLNNNLACSQIGSPLYMAPEIFNNPDYSFKADVWSFGAVVYEIVAGSPIFECYTIQELIQVQSKPFSYPEFFSEEIKEVIGAMMQYNPDNRPEFNDLKRFSFANETLEPKSYESIINPSEVIFEPPNYKFLKSLELDRELNMIKRLISITFELYYKRFYDVVTLFIKYSLEIMESKKFVFNSIIAKTDNSSKIQEIRSKFDENSVQVLAIASISQYSDQIILQENSIISGVNKITQLLYDFEDDNDKILLINVARHFDPSNELLYDSYNLFGEYY